MQALIFQLTGSAPLALHLTTLFILLAVFGVLMLCVHLLLRKFDGD